jgi:hypothetical protein
MEPLVVDALAALERARAAGRGDRRFESFPLEGLLDDPGWRSIWRLLDACEDAEPNLLSHFGSEDELASLLVELLDRPRDHEPVAVAEVAQALAAVPNDLPEQVVSVSLANAELPAGFVAISDRLALVTTYDSRREGRLPSAGRWQDEPTEQLQNLLGRSAYRGYRWDRDDETGQDIDTRATASVVSVEQGPPGRAASRAQVRARYALAAWCLLKPPPEDPSEGEMWPTLATWTPAAHTRNETSTGPLDRGGRGASQRRATGASYLFPPWTMPTGEALTSPFEAMRAAESGGHYAGALLTAARALYLARASTLGLSTLERLVQVQIAQEALSERAQGRHDGNFATCAELFQVWDRLRDAYGSDGVDRATERSREWRNLAVHRAHGYQAHWGSVPPRRAGRGASGLPLTPAVARRDLAIMVTVTTTVTAAVWWIAHDSGFDDAAVARLFQP